MRNVIIVLLFALLGAACSKQSDTPKITPTNQGVNNTGTTGLGYSESDVATQVATGNSDTGSQQTTSPQVSEDAPKQSEAIILPVMSGLGSSIEDCNGLGSLQLFKDDTASAALAMKAVMVYGTDLHSTGYKIYSYTREQISNSSLPLKGSKQEIQLKVSINSPQSELLVKDVTYSADLVLSVWDDSAQSWTLIVATTEARVTIKDFSFQPLNSEHNLFCSGVVNAEIEADYQLSAENERIKFNVVAPLLTPHFPK